VFLTQPQSLSKANTDNSNNGYTYFTDNIESFELFQQLNKL